MNDEDIFLAVIKVDDMYELASAPNVTVKEAMIALASVSVLITKSMIRYKEEIGSKDINDITLTHLSDFNEIFNI